MTNEEMMNNLDEENVAETVKEEKTGYGTRLAKVLLCGAIGAGVTIGIGKLRKKRKAKKSTVQVEIPDTEEETVLTEENVTEVQSELVPFEPNENA